MLIQVERDIPAWFEIACIMFRKFDDWELIIIANVTNTLYYLQ